MTLRARLLITVGVLLVVALVVAGALLIGVTRNNLVADVDNELLSLQQPDLENLIGQQGPRDPTGRRFAILVINPQGVVTESLASGFPNSPDPLPTIPQPNEPPLPLREIVERPSIDGTVAYRVRTLRVVGPPNINGFSVAVAAPLGGVDRSVATLLRSLLLVGFVVLGATIVIGWWLIRRDLRPLEQVTATAERISAGDMSSRVGVRDDGSEVGRLGHAFDTMLDQIQRRFRGAAYGARREGAVRDQAAPVRGRRLARAANAVDRGARLCRAVSRRRAVRGCGA